ncbi:CDP-glycerol glycerophosphotransferase family protein [Eubacterium oxidoreducens]|uniref:CDP-ribitol ribitolphosphotransferase n=1 Tax=Eubacterium oxidoreducens TaxID=1732 RepID=A0A1G6CNE5_EUBOX|nr:CDP-glycerol glycerophosphotransferase family protein [Eubacterium oxidoreducens]SDB34423.1 CDP-ribitol ribitolphosphotransferase [Eubacterium oxidoreducens]
MKYERILKAGIKSLNCLYGIMKKAPTKNRMLFISRQSDKPSFEFEMIAKKMRKKDPDLQVLMLCKTLPGGVNSSVKSKLSYGCHMLTQMRAIATSKLVVLDSYCIPISLFEHKKTLKVVQMWHSMGTMKKFGYQILNQAEGSSYELAHLMRMHKNYDAIFCAGEGYRHYLAEGFGYPDEAVTIMPLPRMDLLLDKDYGAKKKEEIIKHYPKLAEKPVVLYVPTFRKEEGAFQKALNDMVNGWDDAFNLVVKKHPLSQVEIGDGKVLTCPEYSSFDLLFAADYVISDYSCIIYEAAIMEKPLYFYNFDFDLYEDLRGLNLDYLKELPGCISADFTQIMDAIRSGQYDYDRLRRWRDTYVKMTPHATQDIADFLEKML